jgi:23S rRNA (cytidine1920-2'-O)/16S rRNA (cytidine1409-2'-O)-methyltransferase
MNKKVEKMRLDHLLVARGLMENASKARARIMAGDVIVNDHRADKAGQRCASDAQLRLRGQSHPYVSRGGLKLEHALKIWDWPIDEAVCLDVGASKGGFTEVLLQHGAQLVYAVDVGYGQLADSLRTDARVINMERTHILHILKDSLALKPSVAVIDVSFISLTKILAHVVKLLAEEAAIYVLIKPQFEAGREHIAKGGIVKDPKVHQMVISHIINLAQGLRLMVRGVEQSPILGAKGNREFLLALQMVKVNA